MKFILCAVTLSAVAILFSTVRAGDDDEAKKMLKSMSEDCKNATGATDNEVDEMCDKKLPTTKAGKCLLECMLHQFNCMDDEGTFKENDFMDLMRMATEDNKTLTMAEEVVTECKDKKDADGDKCETAALIMQCMDEGAKKRGYEHV